MKNTPDIVPVELGMSTDVAGASFMAAGTSSPELFTNLLGTFVTKGDVGLATVVGSAVFNILGVVTLCGLFAGLVRFSPQHSRDTLEFQKSNSIKELYVECGFQAMPGAGYGH